LGDSGEGGIIAWVLWGIGRERGGGASWRVKRPGRGNQGEMDPWLVKVGARLKVVPKTSSDGFEDACEDTLVILMILEASELMILHVLLYKQVFYCFDGKAQT
jgi:hypothetical protein